MDRGIILRRLRGALGNAVMWGACWAAAGLAVYAMMRIAGEAPLWADAWRGAARLSVVGGIAGAVFSAFIGLRYQGRRLSDISWVQFGVGGGIVAGLFLPVLMFFGRTISGDGPLALTKYASSALIAAVLGGVAAAASMKLAQYADTLRPGRKQDPHGQLEEGNPFASVGQRDPRENKAPAGPRSTDSRNG